MGNDPIKINVSSTHLCEPRSEKTQEIANFRMPCFYFIQFSRLFAPMNDPQLTHISINSNYVRIFQIVKQRSEFKNIDTGYLNSCISKQKEFVGLCITIGTACTSSSSSASLRLILAFSRSLGDLLGSYRISCRFCSSPSAKELHGSALWRQKNYINPIVLGHYPDALQQNSIFS